MAIYFRDSDWVTVRRCAAADGVAMIPLGSLEQHGPHLPCGVDTYQINEMVRRAIERAGDDLPVCVCPTVEYSVVQWASPMASAGVAPLTIERSLVELCHALTDLGFRKILLVHGHGGLTMGRSALWQAMQEKRPAMYVDFMPYEACQAQITEICGEPLGHAGCAETSMMLAIRPDLVHMERAVDGPPDLWSAEVPFQSLRQAGCYAIPPVESLPDGLEGRATQATAEKGRQILDVLAGSIAALIQDLASNPTPAAYQRVYRKPLPEENAT